MHIEKLIINTVLVPVASKLARPKIRKAPNVAHKKAQAPVGNIIDVR